MGGDGCVWVEMVYKMHKYYVCVQGVALGHMIMYTVPCKNHAYRF